MPADACRALARGACWREPEVKPIGLGARDSLRLEAGLCLYGHDIDATTTPVEADSPWPSASAGASEGGFPGADDDPARSSRDGAPRKRVGILPEGRAPAREGTEIHRCERRPSSGEITSGGFGPSVDGPIAMGYVAERPCRRRHAR